MAGWVFSHVRSLDQVLDFSSPTSLAESELQSIDATDPQILVSPRYVDSPVDPRMRELWGEALSTRVGFLAHSRFFKNFLNFAGLRKASELR